MRDEFRLPLALLYGFLLVLTRVGSAVAFVPLPGFRNAPELARVVLALSLTFALFPVWPALGDTVPAAGTFLLWLAAEAALGAGVGLTIAFLTEGFVLGAQILGLQAGYSYASTIDPASQADTSVLQVLAQLAGNLLFFALGMDREVIRAFAWSLESLPPGSFVLRIASAEGILKLGAGLFATGIRLAIPVVALLMMFDIALALMGRINAQLQLLSLAFPVKMLAALLTLAAIAPLLPLLYRQWSEQTLGAMWALVGR